MNNVLTIGVGKGGTGKTFLSTQLALRAHLDHDLSVLVIDLDDQCNATNFLKRNGKAVVADMSASELFTSTVNLVAPDSFTVIAADPDNLRKVVKSGDEHNKMAATFRNNLRTVSKLFDLVIIDTPPASDVRRVASLIASTHTLIPIMLSKESIEGISQTLQNPATGIYNVKKILNPELELLGVAVNHVNGKSKFQQEAFAQIAVSYKSLLIEVPKSADDLARESARGPNAIIFPAYASINSATAILEAQAAGAKLSAMGKRAADPIKQVNRVLDTLLVNMKSIVTQEVAL